MIEFVIILAALVLGVTPLAFGIDAGNGATLAAIIILGAVIARRLILWKQRQSNERNDRGTDHDV